VPPHADCALGDCGQPKTGGLAPTASDALEVLRTAVGSSKCGGLNTCICDVDASQNVTAGDALVVLKKAVGQDVAMTCPCTAGQTTQLLLLIKAQGSYATANLAGTWGLASLASGLGAPWWSRGTTTIQSDGSAAFSLTESNGSTDNFSIRLALASNGIITCTSNCDASFRGALDANETVSVVTMTWASGEQTDGTTELGVVTKRAASYTQADLTGTWGLADVSSGPGAPWWTRGTATIGSNGEFEASFTHSDGSSENVSAVMTLSGTGHIACASGQCPGNFGGALDSGKTVGAITATDGDGSTKLIVICKQAASYSQADLTGTWNLAGLASGADQPWWGRATLTIASDGALSGTIDDSNGASHPQTGTVTIDSSGVVTRSDDPELRCSMDSGKTVMVCTTTR